MNDEFYTVDELAFILNVSTQTIRKLIRKGDIPAIKVGRSYRIPYETIQILKNKVLKLPKG